MLHRGSFVLAVLSLAACAAPAADLERHPRRSGERSTPADVDRGDEEDEGTPVESPMTSAPQIAGASVMEGDMVFPEAKQQGVAASRTSGWTRWPNGVVPYVVEPGMPGPERVTEAVEQWLKLTGIRLIPRTNEPDYVRFFNGKGCWARFGKQGGEQEISIQWDEQKKFGCPTSAVVHEIGHTLGLAHEQARADRDNYVTIHWENIQDGQASQFEKTNFQAIGEYDITSVMQYDGLAFSKNGKPTITAKDGTKLPYPSGLSAKDIAGIKELYAKELSGDNSDLGGAKKVRLTWPSKSPTATYSLDVQDANGSWIAPCVDSGRVKRALSLEFEGFCPSANRWVFMQTMPAVRICWTENEDWARASCEAVPYRGETQLEIRR